MSGELPGPGGAGPKGRNEGMSGERLVAGEGRGQRGGPIDGRRRTKRRRGAGLTYAAPRHGSSCGGRGRWAWRAGVARTDVGVGHVGCAAAGAGCAKMAAAAVVSALVAAARPASAGGS